MTSKALTYGDAISTAIGSINIGDHLCTAGGYFGLNVLGIGLNYLVLKLTNKAQYVAVGKMIANSVLDTAKVVYFHKVNGIAMKADKDERTIIK